MVVGGAWSRLESGSMTVWSTTYYFAGDQRGEEILAEMDREHGITDGRNREGEFHGYFDPNRSPEDFDGMLEAIDHDCWAHVGKRRDMAAS